MMCVRARARPHKNAIGKEAKFPLEMQQRSRVSSGMQFRRLNVERKMKQNVNSLAPGCSLACLPTCLSWHFRTDSTDFFRFFFIVFYCQFIDCAEGAQTFGVCIDIKKRTSISYYFSLSLSPSISLSYSH